MQWCHCIKGKGRFSVKMESLDCKTLLITDLSDWMTDKPYKVPESIVISIKPPGGETLNVELKPGNTIRVVLHGDRYLADGIYCLSIDNCGSVYSIYRAITCKLNCCKRQYLSLTQVIDISALDRVERWLEIIHNTTEAGEIEEATKAFNMAHKELKSLNCNC